MGVMLLYVCLIFLQFRYVYHFCYVRFPHALMGSQTPDLGWPDVVSEELWRDLTLRQRDRLSTATAESGRRACLCKMRLVVIISCLGIAARGIVPTRVWGVRVGELTYSGGRAAEHLHGASPTNAR